jgi:hypothetical protein
MTPVPPDPLVRKLRALRDALTKAARRVNGEKKTAATDAALELDKLANKVRDGTASRAVVDATITDIMLDLDGVGMFFALLAQQATAPPTGERADKQ